MPTEGRAATARPLSSPVITVLVALGIERASLTRAHAVDHGRIAIEQTGPGLERAALAAEAALAGGARALVSFGLAGGLKPGLAAGTVILPRAVLTEGGGHWVADPHWRQRLAAALAEQAVAGDGDLLSVREPLRSASSKASAAAASGAVVVDMESAAIAAAAARRRVPFVALRVVVDEAADAVPSGAERFVDARGEQRLGAAVGAVCRPADWHALWQLACRYRRARRALDSAARVLVAQGFGRDAVELAERD